MKEILCLAEECQNLNEDDECDPSILDGETMDVYCDLGLCDKTCWICGNSSKLIPTTIVPQVIPATVLVLKERKGISLKVGL